MQQPHNQSDRNKKRRSFLIFSIIFFLAVIVWLIFWYFVIPGSSRLQPPCAFYVATGLYCPGCGSTRATHALLHGHLLQSLRFHPLFAPLLPFVLFLLFRFFYTGFTGKEIRIPGSKILYFALAVLIILFAILRNIPIPIFDILRPPVF